jgi:hypothetical protein
MSNFSDSQMLDPLREAPKPHKGESRRVRVRGTSVPIRRGDSSQEMLIGLRNIWSKIEIKKKLLSEPSVGWLEETRLTSTIWFCNSLLAKKC